MSKTTGTGSVFMYIEKIKDLVLKDPYSGSTLGLVAVAGQFFPEYFLTCIYLFIFVFIMQRFYGGTIHMLNLRATNMFKEREKEMEQIKEEIKLKQDKLQAEIENTENENHVRTQIMERKMGLMDMRYKLSSEAIKSALRNDQRLDNLDDAFGELDTIENEYDELKQDLDNPFKSLLEKNPEFKKDNIPVPTKTYHKITILEEGIDDE